MTVSGAELSEYRPVLIERDGSFFFHIDELGLIGRGGDIAAAYQDLRVRYADVLERARAADLLDRFPVPGRGDGLPGARAGAVVVRSDLRGFVLKMLIACGLALAVLLPVGIAIGGAVDRAVAKLHVKGGHQFWEGVEKGLLAMADPAAGLSDEHRDRILAALAVLVTRAKPFVDVLHPLTGAPAPACPGVPPPSSPPLPPSGG